MKIGSHVGNKGPLMLEASALEALSYNANCFMVYLGPPQSSYRKPADELNIAGMQKVISDNHISVDDIIIHAPYIVNLAQPDIEKRKYAIDFIVKELKTMAKVKAKYLIIHPGAHMNKGIEQGLDLISDSFKKIIALTEGDDTYLTIETMAGKGSECCFQFEQIKTIIDKVASPRVKVCLDTCHIHDAGYDIVNDYEGVITKFDEIIGLDNLKVIHLNDSKNICASHKDRHANIGFGNIGFETLAKFAHDKRFADIPKILETPYVTYEEKDYPPYKYEIEMIKNNVFDEDIMGKIISSDH